MFATSFGIFGETWFWVVMIFGWCLCYMAKQAAAVATSPAARGIWSLFSK